MSAPRIPAVALGGLLLWGASLAWAASTAPPPVAAQPGVTTGAAVQATPAAPAGDDEDVVTEDGELGDFDGVERETDASMDCPQLDAELQSLARDFARLPPQPDWAAIADDMRPANPYVVGAGHMLASAALSRVPVVGGLLAAASERPPGTAARQARQMAQIQQAQQTSIAYALLHARRARLTQMFRARGCKVSDFDPPPVLEGGVPAASADAPGAPVATPQAAGQAAASAADDQSK